MVKVSGWLYASEFPLDNSEEWKKGSHAESSMGSKRGNNS